ncbi:MAG: hypothetical protein JRH12_24860 [Deltaproteobacteria bacterium]|jgi:hypothetical protein|nr:hypothetical protein [Deltaproteobacteria bacterium]
MHNKQSNLWMLFLIALTAALLTGCGAKGQPAEFEQTAGEMKAGPGVFTGEEGALVVYDSERGGMLPQFNNRKQSEEGSKEASDKAGIDESATSDKSAESTQLAAGQTSTGEQVTPEAAKDFQEFQEWKKEQKEFRKFQEWKKTSQGAAEYKDFLEWKEWKAYQEWKKQQGQ